MIGFTFSLFLEELRRIECQEVVTRISPLQENLALNQKMAL